ncbi:MAG: hypothetical protein ASARMPREDX12_002683 [Alectoria sarmentosa]|nr:MAG: hypothetical protein ASARMPREDX12_002683 [Alectoria sarmentosa]CAD6582648.1 MAG: hypothetical protein ASARMPRED_001027 [Alectoria sarmentosa]
MASHHTSPQTSASDRHASQSWPPENDELLMRARQQGLNWQPIASQYFPDKTANACRKRHERLMEKRNSADNWDGVKIEILAKAYVDVREQMWKLLAERVGEKWQNVEAKCMEKGLKTLQTVGRTASRREARANLGREIDSDEISDSRFPPHRRERSRSHQDEEDGFNDSAIGPEDHPFVNSNAFGSSRDDHQQAPYSAGGMSNPSPSYSSARSFSINSNASSSLAGFTPTVTAAPQFPSLHQQPQTLPSFSAAFGMPSISAVLHHSPHHSPAVTTH